MKSNRKIQNFFKIPSNLCPDFNFNGMKRTGILIATAFLFAFSSQAQIRDSLSIQNSKTARIAGIALPAVMITYGALSFGNGAIRNLDYSTRNELLEDESIWNDRWDDYLQYSPAVAAFSMKLCGVQSVHKLSDMFILYTLSSALSAGVVFTTKNIIGRKRPDGSSYRSFPSGHTATAFTAAEFLHQEYGDKSVWISIGGYGMASLIGVSRICNNRHWVSDVVAGAGIGILSAKIVYRMYPCLQKTFGKKNKKVQTLVLPGY
ncbi:MAG: phosphatase PAP2 family protein, partial [Dysgonamonadaceae bacterium]|nr:phosphatase PAP2 family protein [Dysgonamonadaceae bacterium]